MHSVVKMLLKGEVGGCALNSHGNYIVDHGKSWENHGIVFLNFCGNPVFVREAFTDDSKQKAELMIEEVKTVFKNNLPDLSWMDDQTRAAAIDKVGVY